MNEQRTAWACSPQAVTRLENARHGGCVQTAPPAGVSTRDDASTLSARRGAMRCKLRARLRASPAARGPADGRSASPSNTAPRAIAASVGLRAAGSRAWGWLPLGGTPRRRVGPEIHRDAACSDLPIGYTEIMSSEPPRTAPRTPIAFPSDRAVGVRNRVCRRWHLGRAGVPHSARLVVARRRGALAALSPGRHDCPVSLARVCRPASVHACNRPRAHRSSRPGSGASRA